MCEVGIGRGEAEEVVFAFKEARASLERVEIKRPRTGVDVAGEEGRAQKRRGIGGAQDAVFIGLGDGRMPRMKCASHSSRFGNADRRGKSPVEGAEQVLGRNGSAQSEARDLCERVNAGVGAA